MTDHDDEGLIHGSGNIFRDFDRPDSDLEQLRALLAAGVTGFQDDQVLSVRKAQEITGTAAADFSRIRCANRGRFTIDRLMTILARLNQQVDVDVAVRPQPQQQDTQSAPAHR